MDMLTDKEREVFITQPALGTLMLCINKWRHEDRDKYSKPE
jgi:hypothetical protein